MTPQDVAIKAALAPLGSLGGRVAVDAPIGGLTTYRVGGTASILVTASSISDLQAVSAALAVSHLSVLVVGRGSNLLVSDAGFIGVAVRLDQSAFGQIDIEGQTVRAGAAVPLPALARQTAEAELTGLEWAVGVPGSVGGGVRMNAGGHGSDISASLLSCQLFDLKRSDPKVATRRLDAMAYRYRHSSVTPTEVVVSADFGLLPGSADISRDTIREIVRWRREHQPGGQNAGSVFTNPPGESAGRIIEYAGLKGLRYQTAMVSTKHANFIQSEPDGSADDIFELMVKIQKQVKAVTGIALRPEVKLIGFESQVSTQGRDSDGVGDDV